MKKPTVLIVVAISLNICHAQRPAQGPVSGILFNPADSGYEIFWKDDFDGNRLDTAKWNVRGIGPRALGFVSPEAVTVEGGCLKLQAFKRNDSMYIGAVGSQKHFETSYGYFECRAELQRSPGVWAAFWLQSPRLAEGDNPVVSGAEIDIMEFFKKLGLDIVSHNVHWGPYGPNQHTTHGMQSYLSGISQGFHLFGLEWTPDKYIFYVDGYKFYEVTEGVSKIDEYIILSMELPNETSDMVHTVFPDVFKVDYIKVYKRHL
jgi:beta-glucanase (GH16 family)